MHTLWVSLKDNVRCNGNKVADVVGRASEIRNRRNSSSGKANSGGEIVHGKETPPQELMHRGSYTQARLYELDIGDPSRNVIEMIVRRATVNPSEPSNRIKRVLRVQNSIETLERFEKYREMVKKMAKEGYMSHPRSTVDGNELLRFYGTTVACCSGNLKRVSELCKAPNCQVCRIIQSNFYTEYSLSNGIQLSTSSEKFGENSIIITRRNKIKRAVIVCRTIAGSMVNMTDKEYEESDSIESQKLLSTSEYLIVRNPSAVLPCFVVVFT
ncbi:PREDICTED: unnamed product [Prunus dulcis]|uniref:PREDICTED: unnamed product n=1 Tax=Prunus dulcis TaxID=3755 RepID=A0A5E4GCH7_PRUDU|nr:uncharacterized protein LOC117625480 [Prunus dulcis]VVA37484.1 PREDICTED: unnamed product [Prunus dulcis]